jgi:hypothetical protein
MEPRSIFQSLSIPNLTLNQLGAALDKRSGCGGDMQLTGLVLCIRYCISAGAPPTMHNMHRLYSAALYLAIKAHSDTFFTASMYAWIAGVTERELVRQEIQMCAGLRWNLLVDGSELVQLVARPKDLLGLADVFRIHAHASHSP